MGLRNERRADVGRVLRHAAGYRGESVRVGVRPRPGRLALRLPCGHPGRLRRPGGTTPTATRPTRPRSCTSRAAPATVRIDLQTEQEPAGHATARRRLGATSSLELCGYPDGRYSTRPPAGGAAARRRRRRRRAVRSPDFGNPGLRFHRTETGQLMCRRASPLCGRRSPTSTARHRRRGHLRPARPGGVDDRWPGGVRGRRPTLVALMVTDKMARPSSCWSASTGWRSTEGRQQPAVARPAREPARVTFTADGVVHQFVEGRRSTRCLWMLFWCSTPREDLVAERRPSASPRQPTSHASYSAPSRGSARTSVVDGLAELREGAVRLAVDVGRQVRPGTSTLILMPTTTWP